MKKYFAYTRVSTTKQGELGVSLQQQKEAIERFAARSNLNILEWLEEQETAAKSGRPVFNRMLKRLRKGEAAGVIMHKIDRSARNLKDWADLGELIDAGIEVHFANESLDLSSRGGRLSADIQAVVAADYVRNLREETKKGFYGRLKQGLWPRPAPLGYLDCGAGQPKIIDPAAGPLILQAFELYASGRYGLVSLTEELFRLGVRTRRGHKVSRNVVARILTDPFYIGLLRIRKTSQTYQGVHQPLVSQAMFERVQRLLAGKRFRGPGMHSFLFRRLIRCKSCGRSLIAELHKAHVYYRCHTPTCPSTILREELIDGAIRKQIHKLRLLPEEVACLDEAVATTRANYTHQLQSELNTLSLQLKAVAERQNRLTDAFVDGALERSEYEQRKTALLMERCNLEEKFRAAQRGDSRVLADLDKYVELVKNAYLLYENGLPEEKRELLEQTMSNRQATGKSLEIVLKSSISAVANRPKCSSGRPSRRKHLTFWRKILDDFVTGKLSG